MKKELMGKKIFIIGIISLISVGIILSTNWNYFIKNKKNYISNNILNNCKSNYKTNNYINNDQYQKNIFNHINTLKSVIYQNNYIYKEYGKTFKNNISYNKIQKKSISNKIRIANSSIRKEINMLSNMILIMNNHPYAYINYFETENFKMPQILIQNTSNIYPTMMNIKTSNDIIDKPNVSFKNISYQSEESLIGIGAISSLLSSSKKLFVSKVNFSYNNIYYFSNISNKLKSLNYSFNKSSNLDTFNTTKNKSPLITNNDGNNNISDTQGSSHSFSFVSQLISLYNFVNRRKAIFGTVLGLMVVTSAIGGIAPFSYYLYRKIKNKLRHKNEFHYNFELREIVDNVHTIENNEADTSFTNNEPIRSDEEEAASNSREDIKITTEKGDGNVSGTSRIGKGQDVQDSREINLTIIPQSGINDSAEHQQLQPDTESLEYSLSNDEHTREMDNALPIHMVQSSSVHINDTPQLFPIEGENGILTNVVPTQFIQDMVDSIMNHALYNQNQNSDDSLPINQDSAVDIQHSIDHSNDWINSRSHTASRHDLEDTVENDLREVNTLPIDSTEHITDSTNSISLFPTVDSKNNLFSNRSFPSSQIEQQISNKSRSYSVDKIENESNHSSLKTNEPIKLLNHNKENVTKTGKSENYSISNYSSINSTNDANNASGPLSNSEDVLLSYNNSRHNGSITEELFYHNTQIYNDPMLQSLQYYSDNIYGMNNGLSFGQSLLNPLSGEYRNISDEDLKQEDYLAAEQLPNNPFGVSREFNVHSGAIMNTYSDESDSLPKSEHDFMSLQPGTYLSSSKYLVFTPEKYTESNISDFISDLYDSQVSPSGTTPENFKKQLIDHARLKLNGIEISSEGLEQSMYNLIYELSNELQSVRKVSGQLVDTSNIPRLIRRMIDVTGQEKRDFYNSFDETTTYGWFRSPHFRQLKIEGNHVDILNSTNEEIMKFSHFLDYVPIVRALIVNSSSNDIIMSQIFRDLRELASHYIIHLFNITKALKDEPAEASSIRTNMHITRDLFNNFSESRMVEKGYDTAFHFRLSTDILEGNILRIALL